MNVKLKFGIDKLVFGMKSQDVIAIYGKPNKEYKDEEDNLIFVYNKNQLRLTFYKDEDYKLGYFVTSNPNLILQETAVIGKPIVEVKKELHKKGIQKWEVDEFDTYENYFNEENWIILQTEFEYVIKLELGALINSKDEFEWKF